MLRPLLSELTIQVEIEAKSNLLIKDGRYTQETKKEWCSVEERKKAPDSIFVSHSELDGLKALARDPAKMNALDYYIPGASVRGAWRSHLEKVLRSLDDTPKVCDPMASKDTDAQRLDRSCSMRLVNKDERVEHPYRNSCPVCKLFGSTAQASRLSFSDGERLPKGEKKAGRAMMVDNVAISRQTGSVISPFKSVVLREAKFSLNMRLRNFELWQVGLLGHLFDDLQAKRVPLGSGKNKGFGVVEARGTSMTVSYYKPSPGMQLQGLHTLVNNAARSAEYGLAAEEAVDLPGIAANAENGTLWRTDLTVAKPAEFWPLVKPRFSREVWDKLNGLGALA